MQLEILKDEGYKLQVHVKKATPALLNALRRTLIAGLPAFAVDKVDFYENNSALVNEYISNRVGLIPLTWEESVAEGAQVTLSLNAEGPCMVYSRDLRSSDEKIRVYNENIPLVKLAADQRLRFEAFAVKGRGNQHAKFQSAIASFGLVPVGSKVTDIKDADRDNAKGEREFQAGEFILFVESYNNVSAADQLKRAVKLLEEKADALADAKELK